MPSPEKGETPMGLRAQFEPHIRFGEFQLDPGTHELWRNGQKFSLQEQPFQILSALLERPGQLISREDLRKRLWSSSTFVDFEHGLNKAVNRLREVLEDSADQPRFIETLPRRGYRFIAAVDRVQNQVAEVQAVEPNPHGQTPSAPGSLAGRKVSHYRVLDILGGGGMGVVYRAEDLKLGRRVALKFLPEELRADTKALERFEREARAASALEHPNICPIYEFGEHDGQPFMVMPLFEGQTLRDLIATRAAPLPTDELLSLAIPITGALETAHQKGIIHRDIKPANVFITTRGEPKILDFGLAKLTADPEAVRSEEMPTGLPSHLGLTRTGVALGTAAYMSPEQVRGEKLDSRTDLFSFGLVLYEMATGQQAFSGETAAALHEAILKRTPAPARDLNPQLPVQLEQTINKALQKDRELRYQSAAQMGTDLESLRRGTEPSRPGRRWPLTVAGVFVLILVFATVLWFMNRQPFSRAELRELRQRQLTANTNENAVVGGAISPDGRYLAYSDLNGIHIKLIETGDTVNVPQPESLKGKQVNWGIVSTWIRDGTGFIANAVVPGQRSSVWAVPITGEPRKLRDDAFAGSVSRDDSSVAFTVANRELWTMKSDGEHARKLFQAAEGDDLFGAEWSPDGERLSYNYFHQLPDGGDFFLQSRDVKGGPSVTAVATHASHVEDWSWLPDGRILYSITDPGPASETCNFWTVRIDPRTGKPNEQPKRLTDFAGFCVDAPSPTADGKKLVFRRWSWQGHIDVADLEANGTRISNLRRLTQNEGRNYPASWTTDSRAVVFGAYRDGQWKIFKQFLDKDVAEPIVTTAKDMYGAEARVSPDGAYVLYLAPPLNHAATYAEVRLMRAPIKGGPSELVLTARIPQYGDYHDPVCARAPAKLCVITEEAEDHKHLIFTAFDPLRGRDRELARFDYGLDDGAYDWDLSPDGTRMAVLKTSQNRVHVLSFDGESPRDIAVKRGAPLQTVNWTSDGKALFASSATPEGSVLLRIDFQGNSQVVWQQKGSIAPWGGDVDLGMGGPSAPWAVPSPDGRHVAIYSWTLGANMWMMENF
jgi:serine/threonine protein kinase